jgi:hypothetical protein
MALLPPPRTLGDHAVNLGLLLVTGMLCSAIVLCYSKHVALTSEAYHGMRTSIFRDMSLANTAFGTMGIGAYEIRDHDVADSPAHGPGGPGGPGSRCDGCVRTPDGISRERFASAATFDAFRSSNAADAADLVRPYLNGATLPPLVREPATSATPRTSVTPSPPTPFAPAQRTGEERLLLRVFDDPYPVHSKISYIRYCKFVADRG